MKKILSLLVLNLVVFGMVSYSLAQEKIVIAGTGDSQELLRILAMAFEQANPGTKVEIPDAIGTSGGVKATAEDKCDIGRTARPIKDTEKAYNLNYQVFACSPVVFAVNPSVKGITNLTFEQIVGIFSGKITFWSELGGQKEKIYIAQREEGDSCRGVLEGGIPGWKEIKQFSGEVIFSTPEEVSTIARYENTIGYIPLSMVKGTRLIVLKVAGAYPSPEDVKNGSYKLVVPFGLVWKGQLKGLAKNFVDFIFSPEGQRIITENGALPVI